MLKRSILTGVLVGMLALAACSGAPVATPAPAEAKAPAATRALAEPTTLPTVAETAAVMTEAPAVTSAPADAPAATGPAAAGQGSATPAAAAQPAAAQVYKIVPGESTAGYEVGETFLDQNRFATAIGVTPQISGEITLDPANPQAAQIGEITIDISQLTSDSARRDNAIRERFLLSSQFPTVTFKPTAIDGLPATYTEGQEITFKVTGDMTVQQTTLPVTWDVTARLQNGELTGTATSAIKMSDFGFGPISLAILRTEDDVKLTLKFVARP